MHVGLTWWSGWVSTQRGCGKYLKWRWLEEHVTTYSSIQWIFLDPITNEKGWSFLRWLLGPRVTNFMATQCHMIVDQETIAGIWDPFRNIGEMEPQPPNKWNPTHPRNRVWKGKARNPSRKKSKSNGSRLVIELIAGQQKIKGHV